MIRTCDGGIVGTNWAGFDQVQCFALGQTLDDIDQHNVVPIFFCQPLRDGPSNISSPHHSHFDTAHETTHPFERVSSHAGLIIFMARPPCDFKIDRAHKIIPIIKIDLDFFLSVFPTQKLFRMVDKLLVGSCLIPS